MKRVNSDNQSDTTVNKNPRTDPDYSEELKLNIICDDDETHIAVLYCSKCEANLCKVCSDSIHSRKALSAHKIVRLTEKPEPFVKCCIHRHKEAELVCKDLYCDEINKPMCSTCHLYGTHKGHNYETLDDEYDKLRTVVASCSKSIGEKQVTCDKNVKEYDKCVSSYTNANQEFVNIQVNKITKFYVEAKSSAVKTYSDFINKQFELMKKLSNNCTSQKIKLDNMSLEAQKITKMRKMEMIEYGDNVRTFIGEAEKKLDEPTNFLTLNCFEIKYPDIESMKIKMEINHDDLSKLPHFQNQPKIQAVYCFECNNERMPYANWGYWVDQSENFVSFVEGDKGFVFNRNDGRSVFELKDEPNDETVDLSQYKYTAAMLWPREDSKEDIEQLREQIKKYWWSNIIVVIDDYDPELLTGFEFKLRMIAETDKRVEFRNFRRITEFWDSFILAE